jgi:S-DNA-T family DNA segregation ATPase FtsK/SpoIIIE
LKERIVSQHVKRKATYKENAAAKEKKPAVTTRHKPQIIGLLMIVMGILLLLALVSHSRADESIADLKLRDMFKLFSGDADIRARADLTTNWLGLFGALIANFLFSSTVGYFALSLPVLLSMWGWYILRRRDLHSLAYYSNFALVFVLLGSTFFGLFRLVKWFPELSPYWSGKIGDFIAGIVSSLIGTTGGLIGVLTIATVLTVFLLDIDLPASLSWLSKLGHGLRNMFQRRMEAAAAERREASMPFREEQIEDDIPVEPVVSKKKRRESIVEPEVPKVTPVRISRANDIEPAVSSNSWSSGFGGSQRRSDGVISLDTLGPQGEADTPRAAAPRQQAPLSPPAAGQTGRTPVKPVVNAAEHSTTQARAESVADEIPEYEEEPVDFEAGPGEGRMITDYDGMDAEEANARLASATLRYVPPSVDLLDPQTHVNVIPDEELKMKADLVKEKLAVFGIEITKIEVKPGPVVTLFELVPDSSVKLSRITALSDDLALALAARGIRIIAPIPGKSAVGIEIPNNTPELVNFCSVVSSPAFNRNKHGISLGVGKGITGEVLCYDLSKMPHLLMAGATGSGKSVGINVMINSILFRMQPSDIKMVMIDPKKIELAQYAGLNRHFLAKCPDISEEIITDPNNAVIVLKSLELEMDVRYTKLAKAGVRHINDYNTKVRNGALKGKDDDTLGIKHYRLPYIVVIIDELADLMITAAREVEEPITRLAQLARAVGIHLIVATQRPSVDVLTGVIKANFPSRIAYQVASRIDSRTILDAVGADRLLGNGDMLFHPSDYPKAVRVQNAYLSTEEVERVVEHISSQRGYYAPYLLPSVRAVKKSQSRSEALENDDLLFDAARLVVRHQQGSVSLLQRRLKIGYSRAARIMDQLEMAGVVGSPDGSKAREVRVEDELELETILQNM